MSGDKTGVLMDITGTLTSVAVSATITTVTQVSIMTTAGTDVLQSLTVAHGMKPTILTTAVASDVYLQAVVRLDIVLTGT